MKKLIWLTFLLPLTAVANPFTVEFCIEKPEGICTGLNADRIRLEAIETEQATQDARLDVLESAPGGGGEATNPVYVVLDSTGKQVGDAAVSVSPTLARVPFSLPLSTGETIEFFASVNGRGFLHPFVAEVDLLGQLFYPDPDCEGQAHLATFPQTALLVPINLGALMVNNQFSPLGDPAELWVATSDIPLSFKIGSIKEPNFGGGGFRCSNSNFIVNNLFPVVLEADLHQLFVPPFRLERVD